MQQLDRDQGYGWHISDEHQQNHIDREEGKYTPVERWQWRLEERIGREQIEPEGRHEHADCEIDANDEAEMDRVNACFRSDGREQGRQQQNGGRRLQHAADKEQHDIDDEQQEPGLKFTSFTGKPLVVISHE